MITTNVQAQKEKNVLRFHMGQKHRSWRAFFTSFQYVPFFGSMWTGIPVFGTLPWLIIGLS